MCVRCRSGPRGGGGRGARAAAGRRRPPERSPCSAKALPRRAGGPLNLWNRLLGFLTAAEGVGPAEAYTGPELRALILIFQLCAIDLRQPVVADLDVYRRRNRHGAGGDRGRRREIHVREAVLQEVEGGVGRIRRLPGGD